VGPARVRAPLSADEPTGCGNDAGPEQPGRDGRVTSANFLKQWATDGGNRRIWMAVRWVF
jgi:hypothetical protein